MWPSEKWRQRNKKMHIATSTQHPHNTVPTLWKWQHTCLVAMRKDADDSRVAALALLLTVECPAVFTARRVSERGSNYRRGARCHTTVDVSAERTSKLCVLLVHRSWISHESHWQRPSFLWKVTLRLACSSGMESNRTALLQAGLKP